MHASMDMGKAGSSRTNGWAIPKFTVKFKESSKVISNANYKKNASDRNDLWEPLETP